MHSKAVLFYSVSYTMHTESSAALFQLLHLTRQPTTFNRLTLLYFIMHSIDFCRILWIKRMKSIKPLLKCPCLTSRHLCITETFAPGHLWHTRAIPLWQLASGKILTPSLQKASPPAVSWILPRCLMTHHTGFFEHPRCILHLSVTLTFHQHIAAYQCIYKSKSMIRHIASLKLTKEPSLRHLGQNVSQPERLRLVRGRGSWDKIWSRFQC